MRNVVRFLRITSDSITRRRRIRRLGRRMFLFIYSSRSLMSIWDEIWDYLVVNLFGCSLGFSRVEMRFGSTVQRMSRLD